MNSIIKKIFGGIGEPPYEYDLLKSLDEKDYPEYLKKMFKMMTGDNLNLKHPKTFNEKIQWLKLYDCSPLKTQLTDKVLVRDYVKEKIGEEYLKPVLQVCKTFDEIKWGELPESFIIKANHGCKWHYIIKKKEKFISNPLIINIIKSHFDGWMRQSFCFYAGFELQYKNINPLIIIEPLMRDVITEKSQEIEIYCFNGKPKIFQKIKYSQPRTATVYDDNYNILDLKFKSDYNIVSKPADDNLRKAVQLSEILSESFKLVRVDWLIYNNRIYFNEMTFTPFSGFYKFTDKKWNYKLGKMLNL